MEEGKKRLTGRERIQRVLDRPIERKIVPPNPLEYSLGLMVGDIIYEKFLPCLSTDGMRSSKIIKVSDEETLEHTRLHDAWWNKVCLFWRDKDEEKHAKSKTEWDELKIYEHMLSKKYMPHVLECHVHKINFDEIKDIEIFKKGIGTSLCDCDMCSYHTGNEYIEIVQEEYHTIIKLKLDLHEKDETL